MLLMAEVFSKVNETSDVQVFPWSRAYQLAISKPNVLIYSLKRSASRESQFVWGGCLANDDLYVWGVKGHLDKPLASFEELRTYSLVVIRDSYTEQYIRPMNFPNIYIRSNQDNNVAMLFSNKVDSIIASEQDIISRSEKLNFDNSQLVKLMKVDELSSKLYFAFSLGTEQHIVDKYQQAFEQIQQRKYSITGYRSCE